MHRLVELPIMPVEFWNREATTFVIFPVDGTHIVFFLIRSNDLFVEFTFCVCPNYLRRGQLCLLTTIME